jgi:mediator of RNA polymerase II transcription subunit 5
MALKMLCSQLARNPLQLDVLLLFDKLSTVLSPICDLLDNWRYDEDQSEYSPVYDEFGSVMLFLLAFVYRYDLAPIDCGVRSPDSFVAGLIRRGYLAKHLSELSAQEMDHLGGWIRGLFDNDGGLPDDLLSSCSPQEFNMLVATLFFNITMAFSSGKLSEETLKSGVECESS